MRPFPRLDATDAMAPEIPRTENASPDVKATSCSGSISWGSSGSSGRDSMLAVEVRKNVPTRIASGRDRSSERKLASGADEVVIRLAPASKVIDQLRRWGLAGPIVGFKYEAAHTVITSAQALQVRVGAALVVANSLCGTVQALVDDGAVARFPDRATLLANLTTRLAALAQVD